MPLIVRSAWGIAPAVVLALFMVYAMMEYMAALLAKLPRQGPAPVDAAELRRRLLDLNDPTRPYRLVAAMWRIWNFNWARANPSRSARTGPSTMFVGW